MSVRGPRGASATLLVFIAVLQAPALAVCTGWAGTASDRHACCATAEHHDGAADACCADGEQRQHGETAGSGFLMPPPALVVLRLQTLTLHTDVRPFDDQSEPNWRTSADTRLLLSVFLI